MDSVREEREGNGTVFAVKTPLMFSPQQQVGTAVSALHEKIERLSEENKQLQEQLHQYAPNY